MLDSEGMDYGFMIVFWGLVISIIDIRINGVNLIPDFIGYLIIIVGLGRAKELDSSFKIARFASWILAPLAVTDIIKIDGTQNSLWPLSVLTSIIYIVFTWFLLDGIIETARQYENEYVKRLAEKVRIAATVILVLPVFQPIPLFPLFPPVILFIVAIALLVGIAELYVIYETAQIFE